MRPASLRWTRERRNAALVDFNDAIFSRASEAAYQDPRNGWTFNLSNPWPGNNVRRILGDGAILVEGARTNLVGAPRDITDTVYWTGAASGALQTANAATGPDGLVLADRVILPSDSHYSRFRAASHVVTNGVFSMFVRAAGTSSAYGASAASDTVTVAGTVGSTWTQIVTPPTGSIAPTPVWGGVPGYTGGTVPDEGNSADLYIDLMQVEAGGAPSSRIRASDRSPESYTFASGNWPSRIASGKWSITFWPSHSSELDQLTSQFLISTSGSSEYVQLYNGGGGGQIYWVKGADFTLRNATWSRYQQLTIVFDWTARTMTLSGFTTGNGTSSPMSGSGTWTSASTLRFGASSVGSDAYFGVIDQPLAA